MKSNMKRILAAVLSLALVLSLSGLSNVTFASAAKKTLKVSSKKVTVKVGSSKKVTVKNKPKGAKVTWTSKKKKIATVTKKGKITGKKAGSTKVICKVTYKKKVGKKKKKVTKKFTIKVTVQKKTTATKAPAATPSANSTVTSAPVSTPTPTPAIPSDVSNLTEEHQSANGITTKDNGQMRQDLTATNLMKYMGLGWNYGNSLEAVPDASVITENTTVTDCETTWGNAPLTQENVNALKKYGFNNVRIPVAWSNLMSDDGTYTINEDYFNRVEEVMNYALNNEMYVIVNIHYDGDWWGQFGDADETVRAQAWARYEAFWTQISERYKEYSDRLIFESANEELGDRLNDDWVNQSTDPKTGVLTVDEQYETILAINQKFVDIVRSSGGNNKYRQLLIAGYNTDITMTCDDRYVMPTDIAENGKTKMSISVHYYTPWNYCGGTEATGSTLNTWGTAAQIRIMHTNIDKMKKFTEQGYGVIFGEFGVQATSVDGIPEFFREFSTYSMQNGMCPVLWDNGMWLSRSQNQINYDNISDVILEITGSTSTFPETGQNTGIPDMTLGDESEMTLKYAWEGTWTKNDGTNENGYCFKTTSCSDGLTVHCNDTWCYWAVIDADFASMNDPYMKITVSNADQSSVTWGYATLASPGDYEGSEKTGLYTYAYTDGWVNKCFKLDKDLLTKRDALYLCFGSGPTITKIEIFDKEAE